MNLIDRYLYAVTQRLPEDIRKDVSRELKANIEDMLPENPTETDVRKVLEKLGNPINLAEEYSPNKRYLIGPTLYDSYFSVLKLVTGIVITILSSITMLKWIFNPPVDSNLTNMIIEFFTDMLVTVIQGVMQGALWVTLSFAVLERSGINEGKIPFIKKKWSLEDLETIPLSDKRKISRGETLFSMFCTVLFTSLVYFNPQLIALYVKGANGVIEVIPLFSAERLQSYIFVIILFAVIQLIIFIWKFISMQWSFPLAMINAIHNIALTILVWVVISDKYLFNQNFFLAIADYSNIPITKVTPIWSNNLWIFGACFAVISIWDAVAAFIKSKK